jgi:hypothetical protein
LLFEENLQERQTITAQFLQAQAALGLDQKRKQAGIDLLHQVLTRDNSHNGAIDLLSWYEA